MKTANAKAKALNAEIDQLEATFDKNRKEMQELAKENKRISNRYDALLEENVRINDRIRDRLEKLWKLEE